MEFYGGTIKLPGGFTLVEVLAGALSLPPETMTEGGGAGVLSMSLLPYPSLLWSTTHSWWIFV